MYFLSECTQAQFSSFRRQSVDNLPGRAAEEIRGRD